MNEPKENPDMVLVPFGSKHLALSVEEYERAMKLGEQMAGEAAAGGARHNNGDSSRKLASAKEVSELFNVPPSGIYEKARKKEITSYRIGKYVRFDVDELREQLRRPQVEIQAEPQVEPWLR